jgi:hypothetical protein
MLSTREKWGLGLGVGVFLMLVNQKRRGPTTFPYAITAEDRLWLARAVEAEGAPAEDVARTLVNLFAQLRTRGFGGSLAALVRAYAQPVNPRHFPSGDLFQQKLASLPPEARPAAIAKAAKREQVHSQRVSFSDATKEAVNAALGSSWDKDWTDYAAPFYDASHKGYEQRTPHLDKTNTFWARFPDVKGYNVVSGNLVAA